MIKSITVTNFLGEWVKINLTDGDPEHGLIIKSIDGLGPAKANINTTDLATMDGSLYNSARLDERNIVLQLYFADAPRIEDARQITYKYFPIKKFLEFLIETDNRILKTNGYVESNEPDIFSEWETAQISIVCPDPYFYSAGEDGNNVTVFFGIEPLFEFPFENPSLTQPLIEFGAIQNKTEQTVVYHGDAEIGVTITIHAVGTATNITIYNTGTREVMKINTDKLSALIGSGIRAGDDIVIKTMRGEKSITLIRTGMSYNILNCLDKGSDWFQLTKGDNIFAFTADYGSENLQFMIENKTIYEGV